MDLKRSFIQVLTRRPLILTACLSVSLVACSLNPRLSGAPNADRSGSAEDPLEKQSLGELDALDRQAREHQKRHEHDAAIASLRAALKIPHLPAKLSGIRGDFHYDIACNEAQLGRTSDALLSLDRAAKNGYADAEHASIDGDLASLRDRPEFAGVLDAFRENARRLRIYDVSVFDSPDLGSSHLHAFEDVRSPAFEELRRKYHLEAVAAKGKTELDKQLALLAWVHNRWPHTGLAEPPHEDALTILREVDAGRRFRCVEYSVVSTQVLQAMGYPARVVGLRMDGSSYGTGRGHVVTEAWNNDLQKWIVLDGQNNATWQIDGMPLSTHEVRLARRSTADRLRFVLGSSAWMPAEPEPKARAEWVRYFEHLMFRYENVQPAGSDRLLTRIDLLDSRERYELLFQGAVDQNHVQTPSVEKIYPVLGRVHVDLAAETAGSPRLRLNLAHSMPWFSHYRVNQNRSETTTKDDHVVLSLQPGRNEISVTAVNAMNVEGKPAKITVDFVPPR